MNTGEVKGGGASQEGRLASGNPRPYVPLVSSQVPHQVLFIQLALNKRERLRGKVKRSGLEKMIEADLIAPGGWVGNKR